ncbi:MAG: hypothetical protein NVS4B8_20110 [Herpetosiphon sp.]
MTIPTPTLSRAASATWSLTHTNPNTDNAPHMVNQRLWCRVLCVYVLILLLLSLMPTASHALPYLDPAILRRWAHDDAPLANGIARGTWTWGPYIHRAQEEVYLESPGGKRTVYYLDKARMEINDPRGNSRQDWYVTTGLLTRELVSGRMQMGNARYELHPPADIAVAGDSGTSLSETITYRDLLPVSSDNNFRNPPRTSASQTLTTTIQPGGKTASDPALGQWGVHLVAYDKTLGHNLADVFVNAMSPEKLRYIAGYPITDPYWAVIRVAGTPQWVLLQAFERRVLTFTPGNRPEWKVEWGNVGRHYAQWRYGAVEDGYEFDPNLSGVGQPQPLDKLVPNGVAALKQRQGSVGIAVVRLGSNDLFTYDGTRLFEMYSVAKLPIMLTLLNRVANDNRAPSTSEMQVIEQMMEQSDNGAASYLLTAVGGAAGVERFLHENGINHTMIVDDAWGASTTTAQDMAQLLAKLGTCTILNQSLCDYAVGVMTRVTPAQAWGVSAGVEPQTMVALKNGWYPDNDGWGINSVGIIAAPGKQYTIAVFTYPSPSMGYGISTIERVSTAIFAAIK